ncbi:hypothetical protein ABFS83_14G294800 [Erythranthe nasuta]
MNYYSLSSLPPPMNLNCSHRCRFRRALVTSAIPRRHHRRRLLKYSPTPANTPTFAPTIFKLSDDGLQITLRRPSTSLQVQQLETKLNQLIGRGREAFDDLRTVVAVDETNGGFVISCRRSSVEFLAALFFSSLVVVIAFRGLFKQISKNSGEVLVYKRDRSLGGKEVVVGKKDTNLPTRRKPTALSLNDADYYYEKKSNRTKILGKSRKEELPQWWPQAVNLGSPEIENKEEYQRMANQLIGAIVDRKMAGEDISANDIVQLRHLCKTYGVKTSISTANTRDSLYRVSVNFVLNYCETISNISTSIQINGEGVPEFIAGLADNIGLESTHAARIVSAAVAARTRSKILQAWALEVQNKHSEALAELFKVCIIHQIFTPEENSPEMEMVARGLDKSLSVEQREQILNSFIAVSGKEIGQSVVEALGLNSS